MSEPNAGAPPRWVRALPAWLRHYRRDQAMQDGIAGLVVTVLLVPQSLAYAMLAGLPPHVGLYASILPLIAYAAFGSSMTLAVGPVAVASLMTASALAPLAAQGSAEYLALAIVLAGLGGLQLLLLGVLRLGFVANLLSHPVVSGFVTGSALLIAIGQLKPLLGIPAQRPERGRIAGVDAGKLAPAAARHRRAWTRGRAAAVEFAPLSRLRCLRARVWRRARPT